jgi:hypothetical protein
MTWAESLGSSIDVPAVVDPMMGRHAVLNSVSHSAKPNVSTSVVVLENSS